MMMEADPAKRPDIEEILLHPNISSKSCFNFLAISPVIKKNLSDYLSATTPSKMTQSAFNHSKATIMISPSTFAQEL
jgi:hypothetical protein